MAKAKAAGAKARHQPQVLSDRNDGKPADRHVGLRTHGETSAGVIAVARPWVEGKRVDQAGEAIGQFRVTRLIRGPPQESRAKDGFFRAIADEPSADRVGPLRNRAEAGVHPVVGRDRICVCRQENAMIPWPGERAGSIHGKAAGRADMSEAVRQIRGDRDQCYRGRLRGGLLGNSKRSVGAIVEHHDDRQRRT
nr:hypothetical protein [Aurantimonas sp. VKM B-3413]